MTAAYIALGSNLQQPLEQLRSATVALGQLPGSHILRTSSIYRSTAIGPAEQPDYLNAALLLETSLAPLELLDAMQQIELQQGRDRKLRWGARTIDLDILLYGNLVMDTTRLTIPHPSMRQRNFVLYPLAEVSDGNLVLPDGTDLGTLVADCPRGDLIDTGLQLLSENCP